ncbi:unnamed protein product, partial [Mesorhabditis belari]|uniref:beta-N-acetylhexosaminidase n=1 Tax=Mesorhabditis belari TaxID=2138241 RepID=A0AAF3FQJ6_9BILA
MAKILRFLLLPPCLLLASIIAQPYQTMEETLVHIDMKGSAARPTYLKQLLGLVAQLGATGVVMEWEDMFPYTGELGNYVNGYAYTLNEVDDVLSYAQQLGLTVIPLVQTLGHAEWVLKMEENLQIREDPKYPMVFCIGHERAQTLIQAMIQQVAQVHSKYGMHFFHIGADEAYQMGQCPEDVALLNTSAYKNDTKRLVFDHMKRVSEIITAKHPGTKVLAWFDEFKTADPKLVKEYELEDLIEPVVWKYTDNLDYYLPSGMWRNLSTMFPNVWGASAFKGANGADKMDNQMAPYIANNKEWFLQTLKHREKFSTFRGVILTGWSRYDHFAALCETMPTSMMSLAVNLQIVQNFVVTDRAAVNMMKTLKCPADTTLDQIMQNQDKCHYPGYRVRDAIRDFLKLKVYYENSTWIHNRERGWLKLSQQITAHTNPYYVDVLSKTYGKLLSSLDTVLKRLKSAMDEIFFEETALEFRITYIDEFYEMISKKLDAIDKVDRQKGWPRRPILGRLIVEAPPVPHRTTKKPPTKPTTTTKVPPTTTKRPTTTRSPPTTTIRSQSNRKSDRKTTPSPKKDPLPTPTPLGGLTDEEKLILRSINPYFSRAK